MVDDQPDSGESIEPPEITTEDIMRIPDPHFTEDNVAIVTGAASGIGRATAIALAGNGLTAVATDVDEEGLDETVDKAAELGLDGRIEPVVGDLAEDEDIEDVVAAAADLGQIRYATNIAGLQHISPVDEFPMDKWDFMYQVMLRAPMYLSKLVLPHIEATDDGVGVIGNMASVHGHYVTRDKAAYNTMKFGLRGLTQSIAAESQGKLRSFSVSTGYVKTPLVLNQIEDTANERGITEREVVEDVMLGQARIKEMMEPIEVGNLFAFGLSNHARHLNGGDLLWDGGYVKTYE
ncbi:MAG: SDR family oxidoreductase [Halobacteriota archaeon]